MSLSCDAGGMEGWSGRGMAERGSLGAGSWGEEQEKAGAEMGTAMSGSKDWRSRWQRREGQAGERNEMHQWEA